MTFTTAPRELDFIEKETLIDLARLVKRLRWQAEQLEYAIEYCKRNNTTKGLSEMVAMSFNSQQHQPQYGGGGGLPVGRYKGVIVASAQENVEKNGQIVGGYLALDLTPIEGPLAGTKQTDRLNLHHVNPKTVEIANKQMSAYCHVTGVYTFKDTAQLHNIPFWFEVGWQKGQEPSAEKPNGGYTEVKALWDINGNEPGKTGGGAMAAAPPAPPVAPAAPPVAPAAPPAGVAPTGAAPAGWGGAPAVDSGVPIPPAGQPGGWGAGAPAAPPAAPAAAPAGWGAPAAGSPPAGWGAR